MAWKVKFSHQAIKALSKMDEPVKIQIVEYMKRRIATCDDPRIFGKGLTGELAGMWRYRVGKYRIICQLDYAVITIAVLIVDKRDKVYASDLQSYTFH